MLYHGIAPGTAVNLRRKRGEHHETGIPADGDLQPPYACKGLQNYRLAAATAPVRRICGRAGYAGRRAGTAGAQTAAPGTGRRLPCGAAGLQHCTAEAFLPGAGATGSKKRLDAAKAVKNLNFPLAFWLIRAIIVRQSFPRPLDGVADIEGCDGHIH